MLIKVHVVKAFTTSIDQGNPAGVILDTHDLSDEQKIQIVRMTGFSECVFFEKRNLRFFSPTQEMNNCIHARIAALSLIEKTDFVEILVEKEACSDKKHIPDVIASMLNINAMDINGPIQAASVGTSKLVIPIKSLAVLLSITPDLEMIKKYCKRESIYGFYPITKETINSDADFHARQFNPLCGIDEDPITGIAAGAFCVYLNNQPNSFKNKFIIEQGYVMNLFGKIYVDKSAAIKIGGHAVVAGIQYIEI